MVEIKNKTNCCGCHACYNVCPKNAIEMKEDEKGFKYPVVDKDKCINCGLCEKVCPISNNKKEVEKNIRVYACYNKNEKERINSSSGGIFILLAKEIIKQGGVVFGACLDERFNVIHTYAEKEEDLKKFMGSKYVQSVIGDNYKKAKKFLDKGRTVLFTGTPCQIEGLKSYLQKDYENLYTQDLICHGVPSPMVWNKYKKYRENTDKDNIKEVSFRNKDNGWKNYNVKFTYSNKNYRETSGNDLFMQSFLRNTVLRDSCYDCNFKKKYRKSDITLADFWGVEKELPEMDDNKGTSIVVLHSENGNKLFELIKDKLEYKQIEFEQFIKYNPSMIKSSPVDKNRESFFKNINVLEFNKNVKKNTAQTPIYIRCVNKAKSIIKKIINK